LEAINLWNWAVGGLVVNFLLAALLFALVEKPVDIWLRMLISSCIAPDQLIVSVTRGIVV
jgi:peptidoglycan/LPS O-acetylase OafA/YrhL